MTRILAILLAAFAAVTASAELRVIGNAFQSAPRLEPFPQVIAVEVVDAQGRPQPDVVVQWGWPYAFTGPEQEPYEVAYVDSASAQPFCTEELGVFCSARTDGTGRVTLGRLEGRKVGTHQISIRAGTESVTYTLEVTPAVTAHLRVDWAEDTRIPLGSAGGPIRFMAVKRDGSALPGVTLSFRSDDAILPQTFAPIVTNPFGEAALPTFTPKPRLGRGEIVASFEDPETHRTVERRVHYVVVDASGKASYQGMYWGGESQSGWGVSVVQHDRELFATIFAYDDAGQPRWWVMPGGGSWSGQAYTASLYAPTSASYRQYDPAQFRLGAAVGSATFDFSATPARMNLVIDGRASSRAIESFDFRGSAPHKVQGLGDMWFDPSANGSGIATLEQVGRLFSVWFTYDASGKTTWFSLPNGFWEASNVWIGDLYRSTSSAWIDGRYDAGRLRTEVVGSYRLVYRADGSAGWFMGAPVIQAGAAWNMQRLPF